MTINNTTNVLSITGFQFTANGVNYDLCPTSICQLLEAIDEIDGFEHDSNNEPVILYVDANLPEGFGYCLWCDFVKIASYTAAMAAHLLEMRESRRQHIATQSKIALMLHSHVAA